MKCLYWNIRGIVNSPTRLALQRILLQQKPDFLLIAEPMMNLNHFPLSWLFRLGFKLFAQNNRPTHLPNLWCFCSLHLNPVILEITSQSVSFTITDNNISFGFSAVYASNNYITIRTLWHNLSQLHLNHQIPWCNFGDFNTILGAHEHKGAHSPARVPMEDFVNWSDTNHLIHLPTRDSFFTWSNRRGGNAFTERRLDRSICNQSWLDMCSSLSCSTLLRHPSDHSPLLLDFNHTTSRFGSQFKFLKMWAMHDDCINLVQNSWNNSFFGSPMYILSQKLKHLKNNLKEWNKNVFGNIHEHVNIAEQEVHHIQAQIDALGLTDSLLHQQKLAHINLDQALDKQEAYGKERSKTNWHLNGDRNTTYFHRIAKIKTKTNLYFHKKW